MEPKHYPSDESEGLRAEAEDLAARLPAIAEPLSLLAAGPRGGAWSLASTDGVEHEFQLEAVDGYLLGVTRFESQTVEPRATLLIHGATAVPQSYYARFARFAASRGFRVVTYDFRGVGRSRPGTLVGFRASMSDWAELDARAVIAWAQRFTGQGPLYSIGHSFGGQLLGLLDEASEVDGSLLVGSQLGYYGHWDALGRAKLGVVWHLLIPSATKLFGFLPGQLGLGVDLPKGVAEEWARWCRTPGYFLGENPSARARFARVAQPIRMYAFTDDDFAPRGAVSELRGALTAANPALVVLAPADVGARQIGHFGFFKPEFADTLWADALAYFDGLQRGVSEPLLPGRAAPLFADLKWSELLQDLEFGRS